MRPRTKRWRWTPPSCIEPEMDGKAGALDRGLQRAQLVATAPPAASARRGRGNRPSCRAPRAARSSASFGPHVPGDIGDGDERVPAALMRGIGLGPDGIVEIARVGAVDGDERHLAQIGRARRASPAAPPRPAASARVGEFRRNAVRVDGDQAEGAGIGAVADALDDARLGQAEAALRSTSASTISPSTAPPRSLSATRNSV